MDAALSSNGRRALRGFFVFVVVFLYDNRQFLVRVKQYE